MIRRKEKKEELVPRDYWGPALLSPMAMMTDMDRIFDEFRSEWERAFLAPRTYAADLARQPLIDLTDNGKEYLLKAEMPGINKDNLSIEVGENEIEISGETKTEEKEEDKDGGYIRRERRYSKFYRALPLPDSVMADKAEAELKDGVLTLKVPKAAPPERKSKKIQVK